LAPVFDVHTNSANPPVRREVTYGVYSISGNTLIPLYNQNQPYLIAYGEENISGPSAKCTKGCSNKNLGYDQGKVTDVLDSQLGGTSVAEQTFFVDRVNVQVFWPALQFINGFQDFRWFGASHQVATISSSAPKGATIVQSSPNMQRPMLCQPGPIGLRGCSTDAP
jgi:hypothetical protein